MEPYTDITPMVRKVLVSMGYTYEGEEGSWLTRKGPR